MRIHLCEQCLHLLQTFFFHTLTQL